MFIAFEIRADNVRRNGRRTEQWTGLRPASLARARRFAVARPAPWRRGPDTLVLCPHGVAACTPSVDKRVSGRRREGMLVQRLCLRSRATQWPVEPPRCTPHTAIACRAAAHCLRPYVRPLCRVARVLLMNDAGSSRARRVCCSVYTTVRRGLIPGVFWWMTRLVLRRAGVAQDAALKPLDACFLHIHNTQAGTHYYAHFITCYFRDAFFWSAAIQLYKETHRTKTAAGCPVRQSMTITITTRLNSLTSLEPTQSCDWGGIIHIVHQTSLLPKILPTTRLIESYPALMAACSRLQPVERSNIGRSIIMSSSRRARSMSLSGGRGRLI